MCVNIVVLQGKYTSYHGGEGHAELRGVMNIPVSIISIYQLCNCVLKSWGHAFYCMLLGGGAHFLYCSRCVHVWHFYFFPSHTIPHLGNWWLIPKHSDSVNIVSCAFSWIQDGCNVLWLVIITYRHWCRCSNCSSVCPHRYGIVRLLAELHSR